MVVILALLLSEQRVMKLALLCCFLRKYQLKMDRMFAVGAVCKQCCLFVAGESLAPRHARGPNNYMLQPLLRPLRLP